MRLIQLKQHIRQSSTLNEFKTHIGEQVKSIKAAGTFKNERIIVTKQGSHIKVAGSNADILNFCANNYLGLSRYLCLNVFN